MSDLLLRGAGERDSRALTDYLDSLGLQRSSSAGIYHLHLSCAALADRVVEALGAYADIVQRPRLPDDGFVAARDLALQSLAGLEDDPRQKVLVHLRRQYFPWPLGRCTMGEMADLLRLTPADCRVYHRRHHVPTGTILALAGRVDPEAVADQVQQHFGAWSAAPPAPPQLRPAPGGMLHVAHASEQTHIGLAYPCVPEVHPDYYAVRLAMEVLGGGMSSRLFTEVREKRGLVYSVWAGYSSLQDRGAVLGYAGTTNERAQATLDTFIAELHRLARGVSAEELARAKTGLKAALIMQGESTSSRAGSLAHDWFIRGCIRTLSEIKAAIDAVTLEQVNAWLAANPPGPFTVVTVGPKELRLPA